MNSKRKPANPITAAAPDYASLWAATAAAERQAARPLDTLAPGERTVELEAQLTGVSVKVAGDSLMRRYRLGLLERRWVRLVAEQHKVLAYRVKENSNRRP